MSENNGDKYIIPGFKPGQSAKRLRKFFQEWGGEDRDTAGNRAWQIVWGPIALILTIGMIIKL